LRLAGGHRPAREQSEHEISEDEMLVRAARDGDRAAFGHLYQRYARMVHGVLLGKVPAGEVDDLVQDVFVKAMSRLSGLRESKSFGAWLAAIARNRANDYHRRAVPEEQLVDGTVGPEIAERTGLSHGSVRVNLHRGMQQLRANLRAHAGGNQAEQERL
jgi:RNA polymerase sigma-70 factor, ECF subfamily